MQECRDEECVYTNVQPVPAHSQPELITQWQQNRKGEVINTENDRWDNSAIHILPPHLPLYFQGVTHYCNLPLSFIILSIFPFIILFARRSSTVTCIL